MIMTQRIAFLDRRLRNTIKSCEEAVVAALLDPLAPYRTHETKAMREQLRELRALHGALHALAADHLAAKANFNPAQLRIPAGQQGAGQWTDGSNGAVSRAVLTDQQGDGVTSNDVILAAEREFPRDNHVILELEEGGPHGGHTIRDHVDKSDDYLIGEVENKVERFSISPGLGVAIYAAEGSFSDVRTANDLVNRALDSDQEKIDRVVNGASGAETINYRSGNVTGKEAYYSIDTDRVEVRSTYSVRVRIVSDQRLDRGFRVLTAFPINQQRRGK